MKRRILIYTLFLSPVLFINELQTIYNINISNKTIIKYLLITFLFIISYESLNKIRFKKINFTRIFNVKIITLSISLFLIIYLIFQKENFINNGILGFLSGNGTYLDMRIDRLGSVKGWFTFSLMIGIILPPLFNSLYGKNSLLFLAALSLLSGSRMIFFMILFTYLASFKFSIKLLITSIFSIVFGIWIWMLTNSSLLTEALFKILKRSILLPGYINLIKLEFSGKFNEIETVGQELYKLIWGGVGNAPSMYFIEILAYSENLILYSISIGILIIFSITRIKKSNNGIDWQLYGIWLIFVGGSYWILIKLILLVFSYNLSKSYENTLYR